MKWRQSSKICENTTASDAKNTQSPAMLFTRRLNVNYTGSSGWKVIWLLTSNIAQGPGWYNFTSTLSSCGTDNSEQWHQSSWQVWYQEQWHQSSWQVWYQEQWHQSSWQVWYQNTKSSIALSWIILLFGLKDWRVLQNSQKSFLVNFEWKTVTEVKEWIF